MIADALRTLELEKQELDKQRSMDAILASSMLRSEEYLPHHAWSNPSSAGIQTSQDAPH
jgi:hypothetical protein